MTHYLSTHLNVIDDQFQHIVKEEESEGEGKDGMEKQEEGNNNMSTVTNGFQLLHEKMHEAVCLIKELIPQVLTQQIVNTIYSRALINYTQNSQNIQFPIQIGPSNQKLKLIIVSFCNRGYGYQNLKNQILQSCSKIEIVENEYKSTLLRTIKEAFKKLETFLIGQRIISKRVNRTQLEQICKKGINYRSHLPPQICQIFHNVLKGLYKFYPYSPVSKEEAFILYRTFKRIIQTSDSAQTKSKNNQLHKKSMKSALVVTVNHAKQQQDTIVKLQQSYRKGRDQKYELHKRWNSNYQQLFLQLYKRTSNISKIRDRFQLVFKNQSQIFTVPALRSKLFKLLRIAIKQILAFLSKNTSNKLPPLIRLSDDRIKLIINSQQFRKIRLLILELYSKGYDGRLLSETINQINLYVSQAENKVSNRSVSGRSKKDNYSEHQEMPAEFHHPKFQKGKRLKYNREINPKGIIGQKFRKDQFVRKDDEDENINLALHYDNESVYNFDQ